MQLVNWDDVPAVEPSDVWIEMPHNGWGALTVWCAGAGRVGRRAAPLTAVSDGHVMPVGDRRPSASGGIGSSDIQSIEDSVNEFLDAAQVPRQPPGYTWYVLRPRSLEPQEFWPKINARAGDLVSNAPRPDEWRAALTVVLADLYADI